MSSDINRLVEELHATLPAGSAGKTGSAGTVDRGDAAGSLSGEAIRLIGWLERVRGAGGVDLLLVAGAPPSMRVDNFLRPLETAPLDGLEIETAVLPALPPHAQRQYRETGISDSSFRVAGLGRFRVNLHRERGRAAAAVRALPVNPPALATLNLPPSIEQLTRLPRGLVLVGGPTGSGKTTTLAAIVDAINRRDARHIITIEDPIEYEHKHQLSVVEQVEIGVDAPDFPTALRAAVRQAPDVIIVGEMRDPETMKAAVAAAETGHLVFSTVHTPDVSSTVARVADFFPPERQHTIRQELSLALAAVLTQNMLPKIGGGIIPACELLMVGYGARQHIRKNALQHLHQEITITRRNGSMTLEESLARLVKDGLVEREDAQPRAVHPEDFESALAALTGV